MATMQLCQPAYVLNFLQRNRDAGHLAQMLQLVQKNKGTTIPLENPAGARWKIREVNDTIYRGKKNEVNGWGKFYLHDEVNMQVLGVVEGITCPCEELVLMTCENESVYAYDGEELHKVASSLKQLLDKGMEYPSSTSYYKGEAFKHMTEKDWDKVRQGPVGKRLDEAHLKLVTAEKSKFLEALK